MIVLYELGLSAYYTMAGEGVSFQVVDVDTFSHNEVVGRCFWSATDMQKAMKSNTPKVLSLGEGCAHCALYTTTPNERSEIRLHHRPVRTILLRPCPAVLRTASESSRCWCTDRISPPTTPACWMRRARATSRHSPRAALLPQLCQHPRRSGAAPRGLAADAGSVRGWPAIVAN